MFLPVLIIMITGCGNGGAGFNTGNTSVTLSWDPPTEKMDGTPVSSSEIGIYKIYHGVSSKNYTMSKTITSSSCESQCTAPVDYLSSGTYYFVISAIDT